ncbi:MAG: hypothetical protein D3903_19760 [Candidatus Electrothrix sp. GM3_4]|nr:hypothetical protein [Candidatus Electrothrix sp. GM3_4]
MRHLICTNSRRGYGKKMAIGQVRAALSIIFPRFIMPEGSARLSWNILVLTDFLLQFFTSAFLYQTTVLQSRLKYNVYLHFNHTGQV